MPSRGSAPVLKVAANIDDAYEGSLTADLVVGRLGVDWAAGITGVQASNAETER